MKFSQLVKCTRHIFLQNLRRKWGRETSSRPLKKLYMKYKWEVCTLVSINLDYNKNKLYKTLDCWSRDMPNFAFLEKNPLLEKDLENILLTIFQEKYFSCSINWPNFNVWLPLLLEILGNMCIAMAPGCDIINFEINLIFLIKLFFYMNKNSRKKSKHLKNKNSF